MIETPEQQKLLRARALAAKVVEPEFRTILLEGIDTAIAMQAAGRVAVEGRKLVDHWRKMPEHITGAQAIRDLDAVLMGGAAPGSYGFRPTAKT